LLNTLSQKALIRLLLWGFVLIPLAMAADAMFHAVLFGEGTFWQQFLAPAFPELACRLLFSIFVLAAIYLGMHYLAKTAQRERTLQQEAHDLNLACRDYENFSEDMLQHLRNTSSEINTAISLLKNRCQDELNDKTRFFLESVVNFNSKLNRQLETSLALTEVPLSQPHRELIQIDKLAEGIAADLQNRHPEREVEFIIQPWISIVSDRKMMAYVIQQLFYSAMDFIPSRQKGRIELGMYQRGLQKVLFVRDNGTGYSEPQAKRIFDAYRENIQDPALPGDTTRLAGAQRIIQRLGGQIWAEGAAGAGGTVFFTYHKARN
jgi:light-regulated signal transduction histidine kinase (bacteriophytochrome)